MAPRKAAKQSKSKRATKAARMARKPNCVAAASKGGSPTKCVRGAGKQNKGCSRPNRSTGRCKVLKNACGYVKAKAKKGSVAHCRRGAKQSARCTQARKGRRCHLKGGRAGPDNYDSDEGSLEGGGGADI